MVYVTYRLLLVLNKWIYVPYLFMLKICKNITVNWKYLSEENINNRTTKPIFIATTKPVFKRSRSKTII